MLRLAAKFPRAVRNGIGPPFSLLKPPPPLPPPQLSRHFSVNSSAFTANPVAVEMIKYATSLARDQKQKNHMRGDYWYWNSVSPLSVMIILRVWLNLLALPYCLKGSHEAAIETLGKIQDLNLSSIAIKVAASEALIGIYLEHYQEDAASAVADLALRTLRSIRQEIGNGVGFEALEARIKALKGLIELISGNLDSALSIFEGSQGNRFSVGNAALCCGQFLHGMRRFSSAKEVYTKVIQDMSEVKDFCDPNNFGACNMTSEEVAISAACALGQLEAHMGNFSNAEEILTAALKKMEERFGSHHPKVGVILTCIALMYRLKATTERSSSLLIQEGLFRRALELLKAPPLDVEGSSENVHRKDIITLARGGYAEILGVQQSRKAEAERLRSWAEASWGNRWMSLGEALELSESSPKVPVIDTRICRAL